MIAATVKIYAVKSRHTINLPSDFVRDSAFPFNVGEELVARIEGESIFIEKKDKNNGSSLFLWVGLNPGLIIVIAKLPGYRRL